MRAILLLLLFLTLSHSAFGQAKEKSETAGPKITFLGTFHFGGTTDLAAVIMDSVLGDRRQKEIKELVNRLKEFNPTKVLLEYPQAKGDTLNARYKRYRQGKFELPKSETYQVGFRLANALEHQAVYAIDHKMDLPFDALMAYCQENGQEDKMQGIVQMVQQFTAKETETLKTTHLVPFLANMNTAKMDRFANALYLKDVLAIGDPSNEVGSEMVATWYHRNMIMLKNIMKTIDSQEDRLLVIVGSSHRALILDLLRNRTDVEYIEVNQFLK